MSKFLKNSLATNLGQTIGKEVGEQEVEFATFISENCDIEGISTEEQGNNLINGQQGAIYDPESGQFQNQPISSNLAGLAGVELASAIDPEYLDSVVEEKIKNLIDEKEVDTFQASFSDYLAVSLSGDEIGEQIVTKEENSRNQGKRQFYVMSNLIGPRISDFVSSNPLKNNDIFISDPFRGRMGFYWSTNEERKKLLFVKKESDKQLYKTTSVASNFIKSGYLGTYQEAILCTFNRDKFRNSSKTFSPSLLNSFIDGDNYDGTIENIGEIQFRYLPTIPSLQAYSDLIFKIDLPYSKKEKNSTNTPINSLFTAVYPDYNFYIKNYEKLLTDPQTKENVLPNMYVLLTQRNAKEPNPYLTQIINLDDNVDLNGKEPGLGSIKNTAGQYYELFTRGYRSSTEQQLELISSRMKNLILSHKDLSLMKNYNANKELFPMSTQISFRTDKLSLFGTILKQVDLYDTFLGKIINRIVADTVNEQMDFVKQASELVDQQGEENYRLVSRLTESKNKSWDVTSTIFEIEQEQKLDTLNQDLIYLGEYQNYRNSLDNPMNQFINSLRVAILKNKAFDFVKNNLRTYKEILEGKGCYSETIMYRIAKFKGKQVNSLSVPIQNIYVPNDSELDVVNYIDTQIKLEQDYTYVIYGYELVLGNTYLYNRVEQGLTSSDRVFEIFNLPSLKIIEIPLTTQTTCVIDRPPSPPEVSINTYKDDPNKVLIMLNGSVNTFKAVPVILDERDEERFEKVRRNQEVEDGRAVEFGGDDFISFVEVYRIDEHPTSYQDFYSGKKGTFSTNNTNSFSMVDNVSPNKKYYYMFRSIDVHNNVSNPTKVVEVEIINENGTIYPLVKRVEFSKLEQTKTSRDLRRLIQIQPNVLQTLLNEESLPVGITSAEQIKNNVQLGFGREKIWGKQIKIRLKSKNTKKVLDFKVKFEHKNVDIDES